MTLLLLACADPGAPSLDSGDSWVPEQGNGVTALAAGGFHSCVLTDGEASCWGAEGAMDYGQADPRPGPFTAIEAGLSHTCALSGADILCWGNDAFGQSSPPLGPTFTALATGDYHSCGLTDQGAVRCWGSDDQGQSSSPEGLFIAVAAGHTHSCALDPGGQPACWGSLQTAPEGPFTAIDAGQDYSCGLRANGEVACWGVVLPILDIAVLSQPATAFSAGPEAICALLEDQHPVCVGGLDAPEGPFTQVATGAEHACALSDQEGAPVQCWGDDRFNQVP